jgi:hypothetical protein
MRYSVSRSLSATCSSCREPKFCRRPCRCADIFYIVKRGLTWVFLKPQGRKSLLRESPTPVSEANRLATGSVSMNIWS